MVFLLFLVEALIHQIDLFDPCVVRDWWGEGFGIVGVQIDLW